MTRRAWLAASIAAGVVSVLVAVSGGFAASVGGVRVSARSWRLAAAVAGAAGLVWLWSAARARAVPVDLEALAAGLEARGRHVTWILSGLTILAALLFSTCSASGADASGYLSQAAMWSHLAIRHVDPLINLPLWPLQPGDTAPLGWRPALERGWQVPNLRSGLALADGGSARPGRNRGCGDGRDPERRRRRRGCRPWRGGSAEARPR